MEIKSIIAAFIMSMCVVGCTDIHSVEAIEKIQYRAKGYARMVPISEMKFTLEQNSNEPLFLLIKLNGVNFEEAFVEEALFQRAMAYSCNTVYKESSIETELDKIKFETTKARSSSKNVFICDSLETYDGMISKSLNLLLPLYSNDHLKDSIDYSSIRALNGDFINNVENILSANEKCGFATNIELVQLGEVDNLFVCQYWLFRNEEAWDVVDIFFDDFDSNILFVDVKQHCSN